MSIFNLYSSLNNEQITSRQLHNTQPTWTSWTLTQLSQRLPVCTTADRFTPSITWWTGSGGTIRDVSMATTPDVQQSQQSHLQLTQPPQLLELQFPIPAASLNVTRQLTLMHKCVCWMVFITMPLDFLTLVSIVRTIFISNSNPFSRTNQIISSFPPWLPMSMVGSWYVERPKLELHQGTVINYSSHGNLTIRKIAIWM